MSGETSITLTRQPDGCWRCVALWQGLPDSGTAPLPAERTLASVAQALDELDWQCLHDKRALPGRFHISRYESIVTVYTSLNSSCTMRGPCAGPRSLNRYSDKSPAPKYSMSSSLSASSSGSSSALTSAPVMVLGFMLAAFLKYGVWKVHSRKAPASTSQARAAINNEVTEEGANA